MKKILIASYSLGFGGIETSLINLLKNFDLNKYKVTLVLEKKEGIYLSDVPKGIDIKEYKVSTSNNIIIRKVKNLFNRIKWLILNYKKYDASISYATYSGPCGFVARTASKNRILFVHNDYYQLFDFDKKKTKNFFNDLMIDKYNHIVFVSNESRKNIQMIYSKLKDKCITINNLINSKKIIEMAKDEINIKQNNKSIFLFVGRLDEKQKRLTLLLDIAKKSKKEKLNNVFWIVGSGPEEKLYKDIVKKEKLNNVIFFGVKKNPYPYIKKCDYLILTSRYEGFPVVYNEAIILNKPIITTIDVTDDFIFIPNRFGYVVNESDIFEKVKELSNKNYKIKETVDYDELNKKRIKKIEELMEISNDKI